MRPRGGSFSLRWYICRIQLIDRLNNNVWLVDSASARTAEVSTRTRAVDVTVKSKRKGERMRRRERALEKAEKVASALASAPPLPKPKKLIISHDPSDPIRAYLRDIGRTKLLTGLEEVTLSRKIQVRTLLSGIIIEECLRITCPHCPVIRIHEIRGGSGEALLTGIRADFRLPSVCYAGSS